MLFGAEIETLERVKKIRLKKYSVSFSESEEKMVKKSREIHC